MIEDNNENDQDIAHITALIPTTVTMEDNEMLNKHYLHVGGGGSNDPDGLREGPRPRWIHNQLLSLLLGHDQGGSLGNC